MEWVVPWRALGALIEPVYPKAGNGRPPVGLERMLRLYFLQHWFNLSDPALEEVLYGSLARHHAPKARDFTNRRYRQHGVVDEAERAKTRTKSKVQAKEEYQIGVTKREFGFAKGRYRRLAKTVHRLFATCALANLLIAQRYLLRQGA
jgi:IS5 family transposase